ncbi:MAG: hypothetical protein V8Q82_08710 [Christensenellales bacterium]
MKLILKDYSWDMDGYIPRAPQGESGKLTMTDAYMAYQLVPSPPPIQPGGSADGYIRLAQETHELKYVFFYLHENERYFNDRIIRFLCGEADRVSPYRLMDLKLACKEEVLRRFQNYDADRGTTFLTYIHRYITDVLLRFRMTEESYSFDSLQEYKDARRIMQLFRDCGESVKEAVRVFAKQNGCTEKTAYEKLTAAWRQRNRLLPTPSNDEGEDWEQDDDLIPDHWDYVALLWAGMEAEKVDQAFRQLSYRDQTLLEQRNAICMNCGRVSSMSSQTTFETLAALFEGSGASGAERAYKRAIEKLTLQLVELGQLHCVRLKQKSVQRKGKKITAAVYAYQVDNGGEWGEIQFDLVGKSAWVEVFAENDPCDSWKITDCAINAVLKCDEGKLLKRAFIPML